MATHKQFRQLSTGGSNDAISVAYHQITRVHEHSSAGDRHVDFSTTIYAWPSMYPADCVGLQLTGLPLIEIA